MSANLNRWSVIIPSNSARRLRRCLKALIDSHPGISPTRMIVIDDGARAEWTDKDPEVTWINGVKPFVYARNVNLGIVAAETDDVLIMGDDVELMTYNAIDILRLATERENVAFVSAAIEGPVANEDQHRLTRNAVRETKNILCFVCVFIPRPWLDKIGLLDERFVAYGGDDRDMSVRAHNAGGRLMICDSVHAIHNDPGMESAYRSRADIDQLLRNGVEIFEKKWQITGGDR